MVKTAQCEEMGSKARDDAIASGECGRIALPRHGNCLDRSVGTEKMARTHGVDPHQHESGSFFLVNSTDLTA